MKEVDVLVVGAGPSGMAAAIAASQLHLKVLLIDEQPAPGGQIWRSVETATARYAVLGKSYVEGSELVRAFRASDVEYLPGARLWRLDSGQRAFVSRDGKAEIIDASALILATGAQERPVPFRGWTLPGVLTVGAAQILLKSAGQVPSGRLWIAGSGPLPLLYATQLLRAGGRIAGYLQTTPKGQWRTATSHLSGALRMWPELAKGLGWMAALRRGGVSVVRDVAEIEAVGNKCVEAVKFRTGSGAVKTAAAETLLVHEGIVPSLHAPLSLDCAVEWDAVQESYNPAVDEWGESSRPGVFIAGDGAGIAGAKAAVLRGELCALRIAERLGRIGRQDAETSAAPIRRRLSRELAIRPFLNALFRPRAQIFAPADDTIVCRCEEVTAGEIRGLANVGRPGPNQLKAATRAGMGPCQGRQCGYTITRLLAAAQDRSPADVGLLHVRPPLTPVTLGELASIDGPAAL